MKKLIFTAIIGLSLIGCQKRNYVCYDQVVDSQGNVVAGTTGKVKKHFSSDSEALLYQQKNSKACLKLN